MTEILAVIVIIATLFMGAVFLIKYLLAMTQATTIQKEANSRAASILTSPSLLKSPVGGKLEMLGFSTEDDRFSWNAYRKTKTSFAVTLTPVSHLVCELVKNQDWSFLLEMYINDIPFSESFCQIEDKNSFTFVYGTGKIEETPITTCLEGEVLCDGGCCFEGQTCCAGECMDACGEINMVGTRDAFTCDCICNEENNFKRLAENNECHCQEYYVLKSDDMSLCVECNTDIDCPASCQQCVDNVCTPSHCCTEEETPCGRGKCCAYNQTCCNDECYDICDFKGASGDRTVDCECTCDTKKGFKLLPIDEVCVCQDGLVKLPSAEGCSECNEDKDCESRGECMLCNELHLCVKGNCCTEKETVCGKNCCSSDEICCNEQCYPKCNFQNASGQRDPDTCKCTCDVGKGFDKFPDKKGLCQCPKDWTRNTDELTNEEFCFPPCDPEDQQKPRATCVRDYEICNPQDKCCSGRPCSSAGYCCPDPKTLKCDKKYQELVIPGDNESGCAYCEDKPISFSGISDIPTDELIFFYFEQDGQRLVLKYQDTGPSGGRERHGEHCWNTNCQHNHVIKEFFIPENYYVDAFSLSGTSCGNGCENVDVSGSALSVVYCTDGSVQTPRVVWRFTIYPKNWKKK